MNLHIPDAYSNDDISADQWQRLSEMKRLPVIIEEGLHEVYNKRHLQRKEKYENYVVLKGNFIPFAWLTNILEVVATH